MPDRMKKVECSQLYICNENGMFFIYHKKERTFHLKERKKHYRLKLRFATAFLWEQKPFRMFSATLEGKSKKKKKKNHAKINWPATAQKKGIR